MFITIMMVSKHSAAASHDPLVCDYSPGKGIPETLCLEKNMVIKTISLKAVKGLGEGMMHDTL